MLTYALAKASRWGALAPTELAEGELVDADPKIADLKRSLAEALRELEAARAEARFFRKVVDGASDPITVIGPDVVRKFASRAMEDLTGFPSHVGTLEELRSHIHVDDQPHVEAALRGVLAAPPGTVARAEYRRRHADGRWIYCEASARNVVSDPDVNGAVVVTREIDRAVRLRQELRDSERMFRALFEGTAIAVTLRDVKGQLFIDCNKAALDLFRCTSREELFGTRPTDLAAPVQADGRPSDVFLRGLVEEALREGSCRSEWLARRLDGTTFTADVRITVLSLEDGRRVMQTMIEDVTDRKRIEQVIRERAHRDELLGDVSRRFLNDDPEAATDATLQRIGATFEAERASLFVPDDRGRRLRCTHRWCLTGSDTAWESLEAYPIPEGAFVPVDGASADPGGPDPGPEIAAGVRVDDWLEGLQRDSGKRILHAPVGYGGRVFGLLSVRAREGRPWQEEDAAALRMIGELVAVGHVRRVAELALARAKEDAIAASQMKSAFLANMSHELRTPLNGVIGMVDLLATTALDARQRRFTEIARASASLLLSVINDVLDFSKIEAGKLEIESLAFSFQEVVEEVGGILALHAEEKGLELSCVSQVDVRTPLMGDPARIRQVLVNLVSNAIKFTPSGEISVRANRVDHGAPDTARVRVEVKDTGIGVPREAQGRLFQPFSQVDASMTRLHGGTGLGLAICRELVERMGGEIGVTSAPGTGSTFWFELPLPVAVGPTAVGAPDPLLVGVRVLAVDDNATNREVLRAQLTGAGMLCETASDGLQALRALTDADASGAPYALVLLDHHMPGMDGREVARRVSIDPRLRAARIVMLGSVARPLDSDEQRTLGIVGYCTKPIWRAQLLRVLASAISGVVFEHSPLGVLPSPRVSERPRARVLLVEDSVINAEVAGEILRGSGYLVDLAEDGAAAIEAARTAAYDIVLMDCQLPGIDGYEASRRIRALERDGSLPARERALPIVALTASATKGDVERCMAAGMNDHVAKPVDARRLLAVIARHLDGEGPPPAGGEKSSSLPVADLSRALDRLRGDRALLRRIATQFAEGAPETRAKLRSAVERRDGKAVAFAAHRLRGQAASFDGDALVAATESLEESARKESWTAAAAALLSIEHELDRLLRALIAGARPS